MAKTVITINKNISEKHPASFNSSLGKTRSEKFSLGGKSGDVHQVEKVKSGKRKKTMQLDPYPRNGPDNWSGAIPFCPVGTPSQSEGRERVGPACVPSNLRNKREPK